MCRRPRGHPSSFTTCCSIETSDPPYSYNTHRILAWDAATIPMELDPNGDAEVDTQYPGLALGWEEATAMSDMDSGRSSDELQVHGSQATPSKPLRHGLVWVCLFLLLGMFLVGGCHRCQPWRKSGNPSQPSAKPFLRQVQLVYPTTSETSATTTWSQRPRRNAQDFPEWTGIVAPWLGDDADDDTDLNEWGY